MQELLGEDVLRLSVNTQRCPGMQTLSKVRWHRWRLLQWLHQSRGPQDLQEKMSAQILLLTQLCEKIKKIKK